MNQGSIRCNVFQEPTHLPKRVGHVVPGVVVNLSWAGWVVKELISTGTQVLFHLLPRGWFTVAKSIKPTLATNQERCDRFEHLQMAKRWCKISNSKTVTVLLNIDYHFVLNDIVHNEPRKTAHVLQEPGIDRKYRRITCVGNWISSFGLFSHWAMLLTTRMLRWVTMSL